MIEHRLSIEIAAPIDRVWDYVGDMANWAAAMPGYRSFKVIDEINSRWTLKVGVAALVRTVNVLVRIDRWEGPAVVEFTYRLDNDPVDGSGRYTARPLSNGDTEIALEVLINGQGPMAPAWEAMARPILPKLALGFAQALKSNIEEQSVKVPGTEQFAEVEFKDDLRTSSWISDIISRLMAFFRRSWRKQKRGHGHGGT